MFWKRLLDRLHAGLPESPGERMRRMHSAWLTEALSAEAEGRARFPRIPIKRVDEGGFSRLMARPSGPAHAARWWDAALHRVE